MNGKPDAIDSLFILRLAAPVKSATCADFLQGSGVCSPRFTKSSDGNVLLGQFMANDGRHSLSDENEGAPSTHTVPLGALSSTVVPISVTLMVEFCSSGISVVMV